MATSVSVKSLSERFKSQAALLVGILVLLFVIEVIDTVLPGNRPLDQWGVIPRSITGLPGIVLSPFLHGGFGHLAGNSLMFFVMGWLILLSGTRSFFQVSASVAVLSGIGVWLFGSPNSVHIGLSGVIFGYFGFLLGRGYYDRKLGSILIALFVGIFYFLDMIFQLFSVEKHISWAGHFFGLVGGVITAWAMFHERRALDDPAL